MAKPCIVKYKGKEYSVEQFSAMLHDGLLNNLIESGAIDQNKLKGDLKLLQDNEISFQLENIFLNSPDKLSSLTEVANFLNDFIKANKLFEDKIENVADDIVVKEFANHISKELKAWDKVKGSKYIGFYDEDIPVRLNPELQKFAEKRYGRKLQDFEVSLYHIVSAFASPSADPKFDSSKGLEVFDKYMKTGVLTGYTDKQATEWEKNAKGKKVDTGRLKFDKNGNPVMKQVAKAYAVDSLEKVKTVIDKFNGDVEKAVNWLFSIHSYQELSDIMNLPTKGEKALSENEYLSKSDGGYGVFAVTGVKLGSYILNRVGNYSTVTKDMWYARTMARLAGESLLEDGEAIKSPWSLTKANLRKRVLADKAFAIVAKKLKTTPAIIQQRIWDFEKRLYEQLGTVEKEGYASEGFIKKAKEILGGDISFRFEKSGTATIKNAPKGTYLNIGLLKGETEELISIDEVLSNLPSDVKVVKQRQVTGTEPTLALQISRKMSDQEMEDFRNATAQMAIPQLSDGKGVIHGTQEWGEFNPEFFVLPNNKQLSSIEGVEITSVEPNEEGPSFRRDDIEATAKALEGVGLTNIWQAVIGNRKYGKPVRVKEDGKTFTIKRTDPATNEPYGFELGDGSPYIRTESGEYTNGDSTYESWNQFLQINEGSGVLDGISDLNDTTEAEVRAREKDLNVSFNTLSDLGFWNKASNIVANFLGYDSPMQAQEQSKEDTEIWKNLVSKAVDLFNSGKIENIVDFYSKVFGMSKEEATDRSGYKTPFTYLSEQYYDAKDNGSNPNLVKAVEDQIGEQGGISFRLTEPSGVSYNETLKMVGLTPSSLEEYAKTIKVTQRQKRIPEAQKAAEEYRKGNITQEQYIKTVREKQPITPLKSVPVIPSLKRVVTSLATDKVEKGIIGLTKEVPNGTLVGLRLDIPAYDSYDTWVVSVHDGANRTSKGGSIGYGQAAVIKNVTFGAEPKATLAIAVDKAKAPIARMFGEWVNEDPQSVKERAEKLMNDPAWTQVGMNPFRHSWFYDKANGNPVISADEVIQVGALVLAKNVVMGSITDKRFATKNDKGEQIFFRKEDKVKGSYFEPAMTTDSKGNYVFFHFSTAPLKSLMKGIDSRKYYSTRTSRDEKGLQYGVASYYTKPTDSENVVGGDKYYVTISPDKVYPMDLDPNGYRAAAEKKIKKNTPFRESKISKEIANAAARDGYEMAVGEWSFDRSGLTKSEIPEFRGDALVPLKPTEITGKEKFKTGEERGIKTEHPDRARLAFNQQVEDLASDIDSYKSSKGKFDDAYEIASTVMVYGGIVEDYGTPNQRVRPLTMKEFDTMTKGLSPKLKQRAEKIRGQMEDNQGMSFRIDEKEIEKPTKNADGSLRYNFNLIQNGKKVGNVVYDILKNKLIIQSINSFKNGIGKLYIEQLKNKYPDKKITGYSTVSARGFWEKMGAIFNESDKQENYDDDSGDLTGFELPNEISFRIDENYKNNIEKQLGKFDEQNKNKKFPSALEVAKYVLPKDIFDRYRNLYEMAARNNIQVTIDLERLPYNAVATYSYGFINLSKLKSSYNINNYEEFAEVFNHEIIHGLLSKGIDGFTKKFDFHNNLQNIMQAVIDNSDSASENVKAIISYIVEAGEEFKVKDYYNATKEESESGNYRTVNDLEELITYAFTNTEFAEFLDSIPASKDIDVKGKSIFQQLKNIIRDYIKKLVKGPTALDEINSVLDKFLDTAWNEQDIAERNSQYNWGLKFNADEISFRADMGQRRITSNPRLMAMLYGANFKDLRRAINISPDSFYTPQKYSQLKPQIANMSDAELLAAIDVDTALEDIFRSTDGPIVGLAFIEYINRLKNLIANTTDQNDIDLYEELIQNAYDSVAPFTTKVAQILRQLGEIKSTIKKDEVQFYLDMIESLINANGYMINEDHRDALRGIIEVVLNSKKNYTTLFQDLVNKGSGVTAQDIQDLNMAEVELQNANAALNMIVAFLSPPSSKDFWSGVLRGNLMSVRSALTGLYSNLINMGVFKYRNLVQSVLSIPFAILKKAGINTFGLEKYQFFNTPIVSNIKYGLFLDVLQDAIVGVTKAIATLGKIMIGKESFRGFLDKSPTANRVFNIIKYGSSALEGGSPVILDKSNHTMTAIRKAMTSKGGKTTLNIRGMKMDVASSFKRTSFSKWFKVNYPGSDYNSLSAKDKKIIQDEFFNDPKAAVPTIGDKAAVLGRAFMAVNSEFVFRLVALSDYLPKTYANNIEMTRLAQTLGLDENQTQLFMRDPAKYIEIMSNVLTPEALNFWIDTVAEVTVTKDTGLGKASTAFVEGIKNYVPMKLMRAFPGLSDNKAFINAVGVWQFIIDSIVPFVKIPMNAISLTADFLIPSKPFMKAIYFSALAIKNKGTDQAEAYALSAMKNYSMTVVALGLRSLAVGLVSVPGLVVLAPGKDDDDEKKKMKSKFSRMSINIDALKRYFTPGEDPSYKDGDQYHSLTAYGVLGILIYNYASINDQANKKYYDEISKAPKNLLPSEGITSNPFDMSTSGFLELELKAFEASQFFIDQSWFVGINSALQGLTGGEKGADQFVNNYIGTLLSTWWGFSSHAQQISDMYREITGKPVFDVTLPTELQNVKKEGYPGVFSDRIWNNIFKKNELIHDAIMKSPEDSEYIKFSMYGEKMSPVAGNTKNKLDVALSIAAPARRVTPNLTKEERFYMAVYENKNKINIPGYELSLAEPTMNKTEKLKVFYKVAEFGQVAETINVMIMPKEYNKINEMAGDALRDLHSTLLSEQGLLDFEVRGKVISPEDIMSKNWGNTKEVANVRNAIAVSISEGNKLLNTFLKPWELFSKPVTNYIGKEEAAVIQEVRSLIDTRLLTYKVLNPNTGKMEMLSSYLVTNPELSNKLYNLAKESILLYLKAASEAINKNDKYRELLDNPEITIEQEKARKEGNF